jgi:hypothetical protein
MVALAPFVFPPELRASLQAMVAAIEAGDQEPRRRLLVNRLFPPTSDRKLVEDVLALMLAVPSRVAASAMRRVLTFDGPAMAAQCTVPTLHLATTPPLNPPHLLSQWLPTVVHGWTVGAGVFGQIEVPDQVNAVEGILRHHV